MTIRFKFTSTVIPCCFLLSLLMSACNNELETLNTTDHSIYPTEYKIGNILQSLDFETLDIIEKEGYYLVEGDILFKKNNLSCYSKVQTRQAYHTTGLINHPKQRTITIGVESSIPISGEDNWREEIQEAISLWNPLSNLKMTYTTEANPDILIKSDASDPLPNYVIAAASWPMNGKPGSTILINLDYNNNKTIPSLQKVYNIVHELGHCFGLRHTNWQSQQESLANHIDGTPNSDPNSIMNGGTAESQWNGFSDGDKLAIRKLYPFFDARFSQFPTSIHTPGVSQYPVTVSATQPIARCYNWTVIAGRLVSTRENSATVIFSSPMTSSISVFITNLYGETYCLRREYSTQKTTLELL